MARCRLLRRRDGSYLVYLTNYISFLQRSMIFGLLSSAGFSSWWTKKGSEGRSTQPPIGFCWTWRLPTPTICRRSVPAYCNAGLPKERILPQDKINKKASFVVLVLMMSTREASQHLMSFTNLSITCKVYTSVPQGANSGRCTQRPHESSHACP